MSNYLISDVTKSRVRELTAAGYSVRQVQAAVGISRPTVVAILNGSHRERNVSPQTRRRYEEREEEREEELRLAAFRALVARRRLRFEQAWQNREPWIDRFVASWNPPEGVL